MVDDKTADPVGIIIGILAQGPVPAPVFRRLAHERGVPVKGIAKAARAAGAQCRRHGLPCAGRGEGGWVWTLRRPPDEGIVSLPGRPGFYARLYRRNKVRQQKLGDTIEEARTRLAELRKQMDEEEAAAGKAPPTRRYRARLAKPVHEQLKEVARECLRLARAVKALEARATLGG